MWRATVVSLSPLRVSAQGLTGADGALPVVAGSSAPLLVGDVVWIDRIRGSSDWLVVTEARGGAAGQQGVQGPQGIQGVKGDKGEKGDTGAAAPVFAAIESSTSTQTLITNATWSKPGHGGTPSYNSGGGVWTFTSTQIAVGASGRYQVFASALWASSTAGRRTLQVALSTVTTPSVVGTVLRSTIGPASGPVVTSVAGEITLNAGDPLSLWVYQDSGGDLNVGERILQIRRVG